MSHQPRRSWATFAWRTEEERSRDGTASRLYQFALTWIIFVPTMLVLRVFECLLPSAFKERSRARKRKNYEKKWRKDIEAKKPRPLPHTRTRAISLGSSKHESGNDNESGLGSFSHLPLDVRIMIWELTIGDQRIALYPGNKRILHHVFSAAEPDTKNIDFSQGMPDFTSSFPQPQVKLSALLKLSRAMYRETALLLYKQSTFILYQNPTLRYLQLTTPPHRFTSIRHLAVQFQVRSSDTFLRNCDGKLAFIEPPPFGPSTWLQTCKILSTMASLRTLFINIRGPFRSDTQIVEVLDTLNNSGITCPKAGFKVRVPWSQDAIHFYDKIMDDANIVRREWFKQMEYPFEVMSIGNLVPDKWTGFEWAED